MKKPPQRWSNQKFRDGQVFMMRVSEIYEHICEKQKERLSDNADAWTLSKEHTIDELLDFGLSPEEVYPIHVVIRSHETYLVSDGITRLRVFKRRGIEKIYAKIYHP